MSSQPATRTSPSSQNSASIPLEVESTGKTIKVGVQLQSQSDEEKVTTNAGEYRAQDQEQLRQQPSAAVSAGMLRALIQGRFGSDAKLCTIDGDAIPDSEIIWSRDADGNVSVKPKLQISSISPSPASRSGSPAAAETSRPNQQQPRHTDPQATTQTADPQRLLAAELSQQVQQRARQLHVARTLLDTDRLKWNQQLDILRQLRDIALNLIAVQRKQQQSAMQQQARRSGSEAGAGAAGDERARLNSDKSVEDLVRLVKEQQQRADDNLARQESRRSEIAAVERTLAMLQRDIAASLGTCCVDQKPQHIAAPQFLRDTILTLGIHQTQIDAVDDEIAQLQSQLAHVRQQRRGLVESNERLNGNVRVVVRQRPFLHIVDGSQPRRLGPPEVGEVVVDEENARVIVSSPATGQREFEFVRAFAGGESSSSQQKQSEIFDQEVIPLLRESIAHGSDCCFLLYGPTGSGKTFTLFGSNPEVLSSVVGTSTDNGEQASWTCPGILELALAEIVQFAGEADVQAIELYMDQLSDLLDPRSFTSSSSTTTRKLATNTTHNNNNNNNNHHQPQFQQQKPQSAASGCWIRVKTVNQGVRLVRKAALRRVTARTLSNEVSSRSHMIVYVRFPVLSADGKIHHVTVTFVDLAGSERVSRSLSSGDRLKEAQSINKSLSALGDVVHALAIQAASTASQHHHHQQQQQVVHVPYRNSKLTQILQPALGGGNTRTLLMVCIPPHLAEQHNMSEIVSTLSFGIRTRGVRNKILT